MALILGSKQAKAGYINERCNLMVGKTLEEAVGTSYTNSKGDQSRYSKQDLQYDLKGGMLVQVGGIAAPATIKKESKKRSSKEEVKAPRAKARKKVQQQSVHAQATKPNGKMRKPLLAELNHMVHFFMAQLRWEYGKVISETGSFEEFDSKLASIDPTFGGKDVANMTELMELFFSKGAKGDRWVPFHAVLGEHERYIMTRIRSLSYLTEGERYALACAFSGSRWPPLFDAVVMPHFPPGLAAVTAEGRQILTDPDEAFKRDGPIHQTFRTFRAAGNKLHTSCFSSHPPKGYAGDEFTWYIVERTRLFLKMGHTVYAKLEVC
jgi:hypothetical protein